MKKKLFISICFLSVIISVILVLGLIESCIESRVDKEILSKYQIGDSKKSILEKEKPEYIFMDLRGPRKIHKEYLLPGYGKPSRSLKEGESVIILTDGVYLYFDDRDILIYKERVGS